MSDKPVGIELRCLMRTVIRNMNKSELKDVICSDIGTNDWILVHIKEHENQNIFQRDLEREFNVTRSTVSKNVDMLVDAGYIERVPVDGDGRLRKLVLTEKSEEIFAKLKLCAEKLELKLIEGFTQEELNTLHGFIKRMAENMNNYPEDNV